MTRRSAPPAALQKARELVRSKPAPRASAPKPQRSATQAGQKQNGPRSRIIAALKALHPMD